MRRPGTRAAGAAASAAIIRHGAGAHRAAMIVRIRRREKLKKVMQYDAKRCIRGGALLRRSSCNSNTERCLCPLREIDHHSSPSKTSKNGAFWCILVHGRCESSKFGRFRGFCPSNDAPRKWERVAHLMHRDACRHACGGERRWLTFRRQTVSLFMALVCLTQINRTWGAGRRVSAD